RWRGGRARARQLARSAFRRSCQSARTRTRSDAGRAALRSGEGVATGRGKPSGREPTVDTRTWIVLADAATAKVYEPQASRRDWKLIAELAHPESRAKESELGTDKPGRVRQSTTGSRAAMEPPTPRKEVEIEKFAREIAKALDDALVRKAY